MPSIMINPAPGRGACTGAGVRTCIAGERASETAEQSIDGTEQVSKKCSHIVNSCVVGWNATNVALHKVLRPAKGCGLTCGHSVIICWSGNRNRGDS